MYQTTCGSVTVQVHMYFHPSIHVSLSVCVYVCSVSVCVYVCSARVCLYICLIIYTYMYIIRICVHAGYMFAYINKHVCIYVCMYVGGWVGIYVCMYVCMCVCVYACTHMYPSISLFLSSSACTYAYMHTGTRVQDPLLWSLELGGCQDGARAVSGFLLRAGPDISAHQGVPSNGLGSGVSGQ